MKIVMTDDFLECQINKKRTPSDCFFLAILPTER